MLPEVRLQEVTREDVKRIFEWLQDDEVCEMWFGRYTYGDPVHLGYVPLRMIDASQEDWDRVFNDPSRCVRSIYTAGGEHIGEGRFAIEEALGDAHLSILIGRKDLWHHGYGTATTKALLNEVFSVHGLYRVWVDVPEYNEPALEMFKKLGFVHEGTLRKSRPHAGSRFDSVVMGMLANEYAPAKTEEQVHTV